MKVTRDKRIVSLISDFRWPQTQGCEKLSGNGELPHVARVSCGKNCIAIIRLNSWFSWPEIEKGMQWVCAPRYTVYHMCIIKPNQFKNRICDMLGHLDLHRKGFTQCIKKCQRCLYSSSSFCHSRRRWSWSPQGNAWIWTAMLCNSLKIVSNVMHCYANYKLMI